jgi:folate-binding Fe-S cluster repair protein YgfZ
MATRYSALTDACLAVHGADAGKFLHAQLSYAVDTLDTTRAPLAGWHDARGRVRALVRVWRLRERWVLVTPRDGADALLERLKRFVLRAAVTLELASDLRIAAVLEPDAAWLAQRALPADTPPNRVVSRGDLAWARIGEDYWQALGAPTALAPLAAALPRRFASGFRPSRPRSPIDSSHRC